jgi:Fe/S biogenesis protein NfuA
MTTDVTQTEQDAPALHFTDAARERIQGFMAGRGKDDPALRVAVQRRSSEGFQYVMGLVEESERDDGDLVLDGGGFTVLVDHRSLEDLRGSTIDFIETASGGGLQIDNPNPVWRDELALAVQTVIDTQINPGVASHGGWVDLLDVKNNVAYVQLGGGCQGCGMADVTLKQGIEALIREGVPRIEAVVDTTDHAAGTNPYYQPAKG